MLAHDIMKGKRMTGEELKETLRAIGWKQADLARKAGVSKNTVSTWASEGPPQWAQNYVRAMAAIKGLHDAFLKTSAPRQTEERQGKSRTAQMTDKPKQATPAA